MTHMIPYDPDVQKVVFCNSSLYIHNPDFQKFIFCNSPLGTRNHFILIFSLFLYILFFSCTSVNQVRTVGKGNIGMEITVGGPLITNLGAPIPSPNFFIGPRYGLLKDLDINALVNITAPIVPGLFDLITGISWVPVQPGIRNQSNLPERGFGVRASFILQWITDFKHGIIIFPAIETAYGWRYHWFNPFLGMTLGLNFYRSNEKTPLAVINPFLGIEFIIKDRASLALTCTAFDCANNFYDSQVDWVYIYNNMTRRRKFGLFGIALGFSWKFGQSKDKSSVFKEETLYSADLKY